MLQKNLYAKIVAISNFEPVTTTFQPFYNLETDDLDGVVKGKQYCTVKLAAVYKGRKKRFLPKTT